MPHAGMESPHYSISARIFVKVKKIRADVFVYYHNSAVWSVV